MIDKKKTQVVQNQKRKIPEFLMKKSKDDDKNQSRITEITIQIDDSNQWEDILDLEDNEVVSSRLRPRNSNKFQHQQTQKSDQKAALPKQDKQNTQKVSEIISDEKEIQQK